MAQQSRRLRRQPLHVHWRVMLDRATRVLIDSSEITDRGEEVCRDRFINWFFGVFWSPGSPLASSW